MDTVDCLLKAMPVKAHAAYAEAAGLQMPRTRFGPRSVLRRYSSLLTGAGWLKNTILLLASCFLFQPISSAQIKPVRRVLILNELGPTYPVINLLDQGIQSGLQNSPYKLEFYDEYLDTLLFPDSSAQQQIRDFLIHKYQNTMPDIIITAGPHALQFMIEEHQKYFPGVPIVFCLPNGLAPGSPAFDSDFTGIEMDVAADATLKAALQLQPGTEHVVVVGGVTYYDKQLEAIVRRQLKTYAEQLDVTYLTDLAMPALLERLKRLPKHTVVLIHALGQDTAGTRFTSNETGPMIAAAANAPVFALTDLFLGHGEVGGDLTDMSQHGSVAASLALRILNGEKPQNIPPVRGNVTYKFDWNAMRRWGLKESNLPPGSIVLDRPASSWQLYKRYVLVAIFVILAQMVAIFALLWQRSRRKKAEVALVRSNERLRLAVEAGKCVAWDLDIRSGRTTWFGDLPTMFGKNSEKFVGQVDDFHRYIHPEDRQRVLEAVSKSRQNHEPYSAEFRILLPDGTIRWVDDRGEHEYARNGEPTRVAGMAVDITERKRAEEALKHSEQKFSSVFQRSPLAISIASMQDQRYVEVNETYEHLTGWRRGEVIGRTPLDIGLWVDPGQREEFVKRLLAEGAARNFEVRVRRKDGQIRTTLGSSEMIECNGEPCGLSVFADVTDLKQAEEAERVSENRLRQFFDTLPEYCFITSASGEILDANPAACKALSYAREELIGKPLSTIYALGSLSKMVDLLEKWQRTGTLHDEEMSIVAKGGQTRTVLLNAGSVKDARGSLLYSTTVLVDVTERQQAEAALRESEERFRLVANAAPVMIWMSGPDKLCNYFNQPWLNFTGRSIHAELGNGWAENVHREDFSACLETYNTAFDRREPFEMEYRMRRHDGEYRWILDLGLPRVQPDGSFAGYIGSCIDVTDRKVAQESLSNMSRKLIEAQEQERTSIARELHDDINQRITLVLVHLERLQRDCSPLPPAVTQRLTEIQEHLSSLGSDVQALSHHLHSSKLEYLGLVTAAASFCRELSEEHGVKIEFHSENVSKQLPKEIALCFFRVLQESLQNAVKHSGSKHFEVSLKGTPNEIELIVRDSGVGFDPEEAIRGRGLGLTSMKERLNLVHGKLSIDSHSAQGTVIRATVPLNFGARTAQAGT